MQLDFHYYATYCAAFLAGYTHEESLEICYSAQMVDCCSRSFLSRIKGPRAAATTQEKLELVDAKADILSLQEMTRIWASFHFLPRDLYAETGKWTAKSYRNKYRLICGPNGELVSDTVELAKNDGSLQAVGIAGGRNRHAYPCGYLGPSILCRHTVPGHQQYQSRLF